MENAIHPPPLVKGIHYLVVPELPLEEQIPLLMWLNGQTCPVIETEGINARKCCFVGDYECWKSSWQNGEVARVIDW